MSDLATAPTTNSLIATVPGVAAVLALLSALFAMVAPGFLSAANLSNVLVQSTILLMIALPMTLIIMTEGLDLSVGAVLTLASVVLALTVVATGSFILGLATALAVGLAFGVLNGVLVAWLAIPPFVATLGTLGVAQGLALIVSDGQSVVGVPPSIQLIYSGTVAGVPMPIVLGGAAYLFFHALLYHTRFGTYVPALGGNREALKLAGVPDRAMLIAVYGLGGIMAGVAAMLLTARMNAGHPTAALGMEFDAIAAVAVGGTSFERGNGWLFGTLLGVFAVGILRNGLNLMAIPSSAQVACIGVLVILALYIDSLRNPS
jgi:ribose transport system permease protein